MNIQITDENVGLFIYFSSNFLDIISVIDVLIILTSREAFRILHKLFQH